ncbi:MAG: LytR family transcriptional regulator [Amycolatopsis sp.]|uniref:LCP family protein n=1 Tax=Amycolatopsis sp. TaxID=37632 RepID=UPI0026391AFB|nr:LCP family protein [Amycolatopsis sp.]MCU1682549.1 LytR family transcriptional regulator [Amycolatopsis sp.]
MLLTPRGWRRSGRVVLGLVSLLVLGATGYAWAQINRLDTGITVADVIPPAAQVPTGTKALTVDQNILLVGLDSRTDAQGNPLPQDLLDTLHAGSSGDGGDTTDTMIVVHIPAGGAAATAISIPRDSYVDIAGGYGKHKINAAYTYGRTNASHSLSAKGVTGADLATQSDAAGATTAIQTVEKLTGLTINHYAAVNLAGFYSLSNAIGGVQVCLNAPVHDTYSGANFPAGNVTLSGVQALEFVRQRHGLLNGDLDRIARQQAFLSSMAKTVLGAGTLTSPSKLSSLIDAVQGAVVIDKGWDILDFAQQLQGMSSGSIDFVTIPIQSLSLLTPSDGDAVKVDPVQVRNFVQNVLAGPAGSTGTSDSPTSTTSSTVASGDVNKVAQSVTTTNAPSTPTAPKVSTASGCVN